MRILLVEMYDERNNVFFAVFFCNVVIHIKCPLLYILVAMDMTVICTFS